MSSRDDTGSPAGGRPISVILMIGQLGLGGTEKQLVLLARGLRRQGVRIRVLVMFGGGPFEERLREAGIDVVHLGFATLSAGWRMPLRNIRAFARLVRDLRRDRPDVLHAFLFYSYVTAAPAAGWPASRCSSRAAAAWVSSPRATPSSSRSSASRPA